MANKSIIFSVPYKDPDGEVGRLGPYFSIQAARNQASRARKKGALVMRIDSAEATWQFHENFH